MEILLSVIILTPLLIFPVAILRSRRKSLTASLTVIFCIAATFHLLFLGSVADLDKDDKQGNFIKYQGKPYRSFIFIYTPFLITTGIYRMRHPRVQS